MKHTHVINLLYERDTVDDPRAMLDKFYGSHYFPDYSEAKQFVDDHNLEVRCHTESSAWRTHTVQALLTDEQALEFKLTFPDFHMEKL